MRKELLEAIKTKPSDFFGGIALFILSFALIYLSILIESYGIL